MNTTTSESYIGYEALVTYIKESKIRSYLRFLDLNRDIIIASLASLINSSLTLAKWKSFNMIWYKRFLNTAKELLEPNIFVEIKKKIDAELSRYSKMLQTFWEEVIEEYEKTTITSFPKEDKENLEVTSFPKEAQDIHINAKETQNIDVKYEKKNLVPADTTVISFSKETQDTDFSIKLIDFCCNILHELENTSDAHLFFKYVEKNITDKIVKYPMDLFTINSKLKNNEYTILEEFEEDIRLIFCNCYTYNDGESEIYCLGKALESVFNKKWNEHLIFQGKQTSKLKRVRDNDADTNSLYLDNSFKKQIQILKQNKDKLVYRQFINDGLLAASAYENLVTGNIIPFIKILKTFLLTRSQISLSSADEPVLQAIVESLLPLKYRIPELSLIMDGKKQKGSGRFGYSDIFILKEIDTHNNNISLELKYISLVGLMKNQKNKFGSNDLENLDRILEKEDEESLLKRVYIYWSKEHQETKQITVGEILNNGINQLRSYMDVISKGKPVDYYSSGVFDKRIKITKSNPNKLKGFVILVVGFRRIIWKPVEEVISNYIYDKI
ncbi:hypothetical protein RclHR1_07460004 [Rhizophagus clarus]|uniref:Bromo domain-containing protein n=1 Tax=Rhizophagus clarus TaxID=94130 RepID=A0A2Z6RWI0_9GLOM|nr:hypothetical protein RclHR1_07460004 [Rhizophagus clarus]GES86164.1 hypothetical protein GLOIN_2v1781474 [Rhizophagus clarus]